MELSCLELGPGWPILGSSHPDSSDGLPWSEGKWSLYLTGHRSTPAECSSITGSRGSVNTDSLCCHSQYTTGSWREFAPGHSDWRDFSQRGVFSPTGRQHVPMPMLSFLYCGPQLLHTGLQALVCALPLQWKMRLTLELPHPTPDNRMPSGLQTPQTRGTS